MYIQSQVLRSVFKANILNRDELKKKINGQIPRCLALVEMDLIEISPSLQWNEH